MHRSKRRAFTLIELVVCIGVVLLIVLVMISVLPGGGRRNHGSRPIKDSTQVRGIHQGMVMWAGNNKGAYPLPSLIDAKNETVAAPAESKDTTANIMSVLIYNGFFGPELCISPAESNGSIKQMTNYAYAAPPAAASPNKALWDPAFSADFTGGRTGHFSYAHNLPAGPRLEDWSDTYSATAPIVGNRGPRVTALAPKGPVFDAASNTLMIHGARTTWEGNIAYNDNHVNFETSLVSTTAVYPNGAGAKIPDCYFFDEPDDAAGRNAFMGLFTTSGVQPAQFTSIWD
jgi:hypothetical protein